LSRVSDQVLTDQELGALQGRSDQRSWERLGSMGPPDGGGLAHGNVVRPDGLACGVPWDWCGSRCLPPRTSRCIRPPSPRGGQVRSSARLTSCPLLMKWGFLYSVPFGSPPAHASPGGWIRSSWPRSRLRYAVTHRVRGVPFWMLRVVDVGHAVPRRASSVSVDRGCAWTDPGQAGCPSACLCAVEYWVRAVARHDRDDRNAPSA
jgi:hypothetical protein